MIVRDRTDVGGYYPNLQNHQSYGLMTHPPIHLIINGWTHGLRRENNIPSSYTLDTDKVVASIEYLLRENQALHARLNQMTELTKVLVAVVQENKSPSLLTHPDARIREFVQSDPETVAREFGTTQWY